MGGMQGRGPFQETEIDKVKTRLLCIPVVAAMLFLAGCSTSTKTPSVSDSAIKDGIQAKLFQDATLKTRDIHVESQNGVVTLTGNVASDMEKLAVEGLARGTTGVAQVNNQLTVAGEVAAKAPAPEQRVASAVVPERPHKARETRHAKKSSETAKSSVVEAPAPEPASQAPAPAPAPAASQVAQAEPPAPPQPPPPPAPVQVTVPAGTVITVRMIDSIDSATNRAGEEFQASLEVPVVVGDKVLIQRGADARVRLVQDTSAGHVQGRSEVKLELVSISANGTTYEPPNRLLREAGGFTRQANRGHDRRSKRSRCAHRRDRRRRKRRGHWRRRRRGRRGRCHRGHQGGASQGATRDQTRFHSEEPLRGHNESVRSI